MWIVASIALIILFFFISGLIFSNRLTEKLIGVRNKFSSTFNPEQYRNSTLCEYQKHIVTSFDGTKLTITHFPARDSRHKGCILLIHGIRYGKEYYYPVADKLSEKGYHCLVPDLRAHGESEGEYCTYGAKEKYDIYATMDYAEQDLKITGGFGIWGHSMGASIALLAMEKDKRIHCAILEAPFSDLQLIIQEYVQQQIPFLPKRIVNLILHQAGKKANFNPLQIKPSKTAKNIYKPVMLIHGKDDKRIQLHHSREIYNQLPTDTKILFELKNCNHHNIREVWKDDYIERSLQFIKNNFSFLEYS